VIDMADLPGQPGLEHYANKLREEVVCCRSIGK